MATESELKIPVDDLESIRARLDSAGAGCARRSEHEVNVVLDRADHHLEGLQQLLRVRRFGGRWILTFKGTPRFEGAVKQREELELEVSDGETLIELLGRLGFDPAVRYEKEREVWRLSGVEVTLDHTPMGDFVELEGETADLAGVALRLGLDPGAAVRGNYLELWRQYRDQHPELELPPDMVFGR
jgi:adenylate cyclase class 2